MTYENISPEERLFRVIQGQKAPHPAEIEFKKKRAIEPRSIRQFFESLKPKILAKIAASPDIYHIDIKAVNNCLAGILVFFTVTVIYYTIAKKPDIAKVTKALSDIQIQETGKKPQIEALKPISDYLAQIKKRGILAAPSKAEKPPPLAKGKEPASKLNDLAKDLKLKGIAWGKSPKAIVSNEKENRTYFLGEAQVIGSTGIEIKVILKHKVIISYGNEEMELT
ncbi:MAG: hypothetical protein V1927_05815 [Candidatus Omnitrophota bacterium]